MCIVRHFLDLSNKTVDLEQSWLDCETGRLYLVMTKAGVLESLLQLSLSNTAGLSVSGWLEAGEGSGRTWNCLEAGERERERELVFTIQPGVHYQLGIAV